MAERPPGELCEPSATETSTPRPLTAAANEPLAAPANAPLAAAVNTSRRAGPPAARVIDRSRRRLWLRRGLVVVGGALLVCVFGAGALGYRVTRRWSASEPYPESATGLREVAPRTASSELVVAADPQAAEAAAAMLARGGSALDAAIAAQLVLGLVEPQSSGIGGGAFLLYWDAAAQHLHAYDGREVAPRAARKDLFMAAGQPLSFPRALIGGRSVGVPGVLRLLERAHAQHGRLPFAASFSDAIALARRGFHVSPRYAKLAALDPVLPTLAAARAGLLADSGAAPAAGALRTNLAYAASLAQIAERGPSTFYGGAIGRDIVAAVSGARQPTLARGVWNLALGELGFAMGGSAEVRAPGSLAATDLDSYRALEREALCIRYRAYRVCSMPPPAGGLTVLQTLAMLERFPLASYAPLSPDALHLLAEAERLAYADRDFWLGDPSFTEVPAAGLLSGEYTRTRSAQISLAHALLKAEPGRPTGAESRYESARSPEQPATSHFSVVDRAGNIACMTTSIEFAFGSHLMVGGFLLNNQLTDFSFEPERAGRLVANSVAPGKRPRSAMSPTLIFDADSGRPIAALGAAGGPAISGYVVQTIVALLDWKLSPQAAVALPHVINRNRKTELEDLGWPSPAARETLVKALEARGHQVDIGQQNSGLHVLSLGTGRLEAGIDPRRFGGAAGR